MLDRVYSPVSRISKKVVFSLILVALLAVTVVATFRFNITGSYEGIFLLRGENGALFELQDDLYLGQEGRYIAGIDFEDEKQFLWKLLHRAEAKEPYLYYEWNKKSGEGFVRNYLPGGKQVVTFFSRFEDEFGKEAEGLFVGGGLPSSIREDNMLKKSATGMAYYDGTRWVHVWCNANEMISNSRLEPIYPHSWKYLGSKIIRGNTGNLIIRSRHEAIVDNVPLRIDRHAYFRAGATYFLLSIQIKNIGTVPATFDYVYGDDPWLGDFGSSAGNVGWAADGLYKYVGGLDVKRIHYAGYFDYGNDAAGEGHNFAGIANFIEWFGTEPSFVYFSNGPFDIPPLNGERLPLNSNARFIGINWSQTLQPNQTKIYTLAIGMAGRDPKTGFPMKPDINLNAFP